MANWKFIAGSAGFAFFISFLTGLFSGVQFGTLMLRAVLGGAAFGGLAFGIDYVVKQYLPELAKALSSGEQEKEASPKVDIVIEDESPPGSPAADRAQSAPEPTKTAAGQTEDEIDNSEDTTEELSYPDNDSDDSDDSEEFVEEVEELDGAEESAAPIPKSSEAGGETAEEIADLEAVDDDEATIDALPDIDNLSDSFNHTESTEEDWEETGAGQDSNMTVDVGGVEEDPRTIAKAVQTMLKKE